MPTAIDGDPAADADQRVGETEERALPESEVLAALHEHADVAAGRGVGVDEGADLVDGQSQAAMKPTIPATMRKLPRTTGFPLAADVIHRRSRAETPDAPGRHGGEQGEPGKCGRKAEAASIPCGAAASPGRGQCLESGDHQHEAGEHPGKADHGQENR